MVSYTKWCGKLQPFLVASNGTYLEVAENDSLQLRMVRRASREEKLAALSGDTAHLVTQLTRGGHVKGIGKDGGRHVRSIRKITQRKRAQTGGALAQRRANAERGKLRGDLKAMTPVRQRHRKLADAVRVDIMSNNDFVTRPTVNL